MEGGKVVGLTAADPLAVLDDLAIDPFAAGVLDVIRDGAILQDVNDRELNVLKQERPTAWVRYLSDRVKLGVPTDEQVERCAETRLTRWRDATAPCRCPMPVASLVAARRRGPLPISGRPIILART